MASKRELEALIVLAGKVDPSLQNALRKAQGETTKTSSSMKKLTDMSNKFIGGVVKTAVTVGAGIAAALAVVGNKGTELASDLYEVQNVVDTSFSQSANQINKWADSALNSFGLSELQAKQFTGTLGAMFKSSGITGKSLITMSENLSGLAGDFSSFYNLNTEEAFNKIRAGISGETEPLKQLGINMNVANLEAFALSKGIKQSYQKMDQASQVALRYAYLMEVSKDAQGDFTKTLDTSYANQKRLFQNNFNQKLAEIASKTLPKLTEGYKIFNGILGKINTDKAADIIATGVSGIAEKIGDVIDVATDLYKFISGNWSIIEPIIWGIVGAIAAWKAITLGMVIYESIMALIAIANGTATASQLALNAAVLANPMTWIILGIVAAVGALIAIGVYLYRNWDEISAKAQALWVQVKSVFSGIGEAIGGAFKFGMNIAISAINRIIRAVNSLSFKIPDWVPAIGGKQVGFKIPEFPMFAHGGFTNQPSIFGEAGLEAAIPIKYKSPRSIGLLNQTAKAIGADDPEGGAAASFVFAPQIYGGNTAEVRQILEEEMEKFKAMAEAWLLEKERVAFG